MSTPTSAIHFRGARLLELQPGEPKTWLSEEDQTSCAYIHPYIGSCGCVPCSRSRSIQWLNEQEAKARLEREKLAAREAA
jgi:hypothetical protein